MNYFINESCITNDLSIIPDFAIPLADNGLTGDRKMRLFVAPICNTVILLQDASFACYIQTNSNPIFLGYMSKSGDIELQEEVLRDLGEHYWLQNAQRDNGENIDTLVDAILEAIFHE